MPKQPVCGNTPALTRRSLLASMPAIACVPAIGAEAAPEIMDTPFLVPISGEPGMVALCYPKTKIDYAYRYMLSDGTTIFAEGRRWSDGSPGGWREMLPGQFDGRVIGRVVSVHLKDRSGWRQGGSAHLAG